MCDKAAKKKGLISNDETLYRPYSGEYQRPECKDIRIGLTDVADGLITRLVNCYYYPRSLPDTIYFFIGKGQSEYGAYEFECKSLEPSCTPKGNIANVFA